MDDDVACLMTVNFNQDSKSLAVGHQDGYILYNTLEAVEGDLRVHNKDTSSALKKPVIVERLFNSSLVIVVSQNEPRVMHVYHFQTQQMICDHRFPKSILAIKLNRDRVVAILEDSITIYNLKDMKILHTIEETPLNRHGLADLTCGTTVLLAYPGSTDIGTVNIFDATNLRALNNFAAHTGPLAALKFNMEGTMLATASTKGTVIRIFSVTAGTKLFEFRRGVARCVTINSMAFSPNSTYLCTSSNTETVHVFKLEKPSDSEQKPPATDSSWYGYIASTASALLPQMNELVIVERSFATARLPGNNRRSVAAMPVIQDQVYLLVATSDGFLYCYKVDNHGGELNLVKQHRIGPRAAEDQIGNVHSGAAVEENQHVPDTSDSSEFPPISHTA